MRKLNALIIMSMKPSAIIVKFMGPGSEVQDLWLGQYRNKVKKYLTLKNCHLYSDIHVYLEKLNA